MKLAYLAFAYKNPRLLQREIAVLSCSDSHFYVHIDQKSDIAPFSAIAAPNVTLLQNRVAVYWAEFTGVIAILNLIRSALHGPKRYDYLVLLSGSEYPLRSCTYINSFFEANEGSELIDLVKIPNLRAGKKLEHFNAIRFPSHRPILQFLVRALARLRVINRDYRKHLGRLEPYGGHTWWALSRGACEHILNFVVENPKVVGFFQYSAQPEETFFHTILGNSPFRERVRRSIFFEDWSAGGARPAMISQKHLELFASNETVWLNDAFGVGEALFARKFSDETLHLLDRIDERRGTNQHVLTNET